MQKIEHHDDEADRQALRNALDAGITHIDTAEMYATGHAEELVGEVIKDYDRKKIFLVSKVWGTNLAYDDVLSSCEKSLSRLRTDYLDLYLIHYPNPLIPIKNTMKAFDRLKQMGLIRNIGVSNFSVKRFKDAQSNSENKIVANQLHYNLVIREVEKIGLLDYCQREDIMLIAWRPLQKGIFADKNFTILNDLSRKYNKTPVQIALNWLISQKNVVTLSKMSNRNHLIENLDAVGWNMEKKDIEKLRRKFPGQLEVSDAIRVGIL